MWRSGNLTIQRELTRDLVWEIAYVGNHGVKLYGAYEGNQPFPGPGSVNTRRPLAGNVTLSLQLRSNIAEVFTSAGRYDEAATYCNKLPLDHPGRNRCLGRSLLGQGRTEEAIRILIKSDIKSDRANLGYAYARSGRREEAEKLASDLSPRPLQQAVIFAGLGAKDRTLDALDRMAGVGPVRMG